MARKTTQVVVPFEGRDKGKNFVLTEMPAAQAERWALRALMAVGASGIVLPESIAGAGMAGIAFIGLKAIFQIPFDQAEVLMQEMMTCVQYIDDPARPFPRRLYDDDIEEPATLFWLKSEVFELHTGFSPAGAISELRSKLAEAMKPSDTSTFQEPPAPSSQAA